MRSKMQRLMAIFQLRTIDGSLFFKGHFSFHYCVPLIVGAFCRSLFLLWSSSPPSPAAPNRPSLRPPPRLPALVHRPLHLPRLHLLPDPDVDPDLAPPPSPTPRPGPNAQIPPCRQRAPSGR